MTCRSGAKSWSWITIAATCWIWSACHSSRLPTTRLAQYSIVQTATLDHGTLTISLKNPLHCPLRIWMFHPDASLQARFNDIQPVTMEARSDTLLTFEIQPTISAEEVTISSRLGSLDQPVNLQPVELPFPAGRTYRVLQGNQTDFTHHTEWSQFAVDFNLDVKDTVCAATDGYVVGIVDGYTHGGPEKKWKPFANFITLYDPDSGVFTQYVHLAHQGSLVAMGAEVCRGQPIGLSGNTGQTTTPHLHFNCLVPTNNADGLKSIPFTLVGGKSSQSLQKNDLLSKPRE